MLQVISPIGPCSLYCMETSGSNLVFTDSGGHIISVFNPGILGPKSGIDASIDSVTLNGSIETTPSHYLDGENDCHHVNYRGVIFPTENIQSSAGSVQWSTAWPGFPDDAAEPHLDIRNQSGLFLAVSHLLPYDQPADLVQEVDLCTKSWGSYVYVGSRINLFMARRRGNLTYVAYCKTSYTKPYPKDLSNRLTFHVVEFSPSQGYRYSGLTNVKPNPPITTSAELEKFMSQYYDGDYTPTGPFRLPTAFPCIPLLFTEYAKPDYPAILNRLLQGTDDFLPVRLYQDVDWGELSYQALDQIQSWDSNGLALSKEMIGLRKEVASILKLIADIENPRKWASAFLSYKYGVRLTISDAKSLIKAMLQEQDLHLGPAKVSSGTNFIKNGCACEAHYAVYYQRSPHVVDQIYSALDRFDMAPTLTNVWDLLPFTFVVDWFVDFGGLLDRLDAVATLSSHQLVGDMRSLKITRSLLPAALGLQGWGGSIDVIKYVRVSSDICELPSLVLDVPVTKGFDHFIEAGALIIQKIFH